MGKQTHTRDIPSQLNPTGQQKQSLCWWAPFRQRSRAKRRQSRDSERRGDRFQSGEETEIQSGDSELRGDRDWDRDRDSDDKHSDRDSERRGDRDSERRFRPPQRRQRFRPPLKKQSPRVGKPQPQLLQDTVVAPTATVIEDTEKTQQQYRDPELRKVIQYLQSGVLQEYDVELFSDS